MTYKTIGDSHLDLIEDMKKDPRSQMIPLTPQVDSAQVVDDETFDQKRFTEMVKACPERSKTACPSPETFKAVFARMDAEAVSVIILSSHLSGSYNSMVVVKRLYEEEMAEKGMAEQAKKVVAIDSLSVSSGEFNIVLFIQNLCDSGLEFDKVVEKTLAYRGGMNTYFVLEGLDTLRKNGRLSGLQAFFVTALNIKPVMGAGTGIIIKLNQARGTNKTLHRMYDIVVKEVVDAAGKITVVRRVNNPERAEYAKNKLTKRVGFKKIVAINAVGVATVHTNDGRIVLAV